MTMAQHEKDVAALSRLIKQLTSKKETSDSTRLDLLKKTQKAAQAILMDDLISELAQEVSGLEQRIEEALKQRREQLLRAARDANIPHKRFTDYDMVGIFKVSYKGRKVQLDVGSEAWMTVEEMDGNKLFDAINKATEELESVPFSREEFFKTLKSAFSYARADGQVQDGSIAIKTLYTYVVSARQLRSDKYLKNPTMKSFQDYSMAQFAYDFARFGRDGWSFDKECLRTMTPNMATIKEGKAIMLPSIGTVENSGPQVATLKIEKREC
jgi:hypothetical protein